MFEHGTSLFQGDAREPLHEIGDLGSILEVLEQSRDRYTGATKHPGTANAARVSFNSSAGAPVDHGLMLRRQPGSGKLKAANAQAQRSAAGMPHGEGTLSFGLHPSALSEAAPRFRCSLLLGVRLSTVHPVLKPLTLRRNPWAPQLPWSTDVQPKVAEQLERDQSRN